MQRIFVCFNDKKSIVPVNQEEFEKFLNKMPEKLSVTVQPYKNQRSSSQNNYYFGVVVQIIAKDTGNTMEDVHEALKSMFLPKSVTLKNVIGSVGRSTASLKTDEFEIYLENIRRWASTQGLDIPLPNEERKGVVYGTSSSI